MGYFKNAIRRWLDIDDPLPIIEVSMEAQPDSEAVLEAMRAADPKAISVPRRAEEDKVLPLDTYGENRAEVADALAIAGVLNGSAPPPAPRHAKRTIPNTTPQRACVVDPTDPAALLGSLKR